MTKKMIAVAKGSPDRFAQCYNEYMLKKEEDRRPILGIEYQYFPFPDGEGFGFILLELGHPSIPITATLPTSGGSKE